MTNFQEHPQGMLLTDSIGPVLERLHPDNRYAIGQDCGIYWKLIDPLVRGAICPDWFYVPNVRPTPDGTMRRSYVLWKELVPSLIVLEFVSGDGSEERDQTPMSGKFWVYEQVVRVPFYGIYEVDPGRIEMYHLVNDHYELLPPNGRGHYPIDGLGVELGIWRGLYQTANLPWMRWWDSEGNLLPTGEELAELEANPGQSRGGTQRTIEASLVNTRPNAANNWPRNRATRPNNWPNARPIGPNARPSGPNDWPSNSGHWASSPRPEVIRPQPSGWASRFSRICASQAVGQEAHDDSHHVGEPVGDVPIAVDEPVHLAQLGDRRQGEAAEEDPSPPAVCPTDPHPEEREDREDPHVNQLVEVRHEERLG